VYERLALRDRDGWRSSPRPHPGPVEAAGRGGINVNDTTELQAPFGGWKLSGSGRELGPEGLIAFRETKHIKVRMRFG
jgi:hypothetical protein